MRTRNFLLAAIMGAVAMPVFAQDELEEVVVTARKRDESIFEIPVSVSAMSQEQLERAGIDNAEELSAFVAGLDFNGSTSTGGRVNPEIRFRGMHQQIITPATQVGALFWDGSYIAAGGGFLPLADVERVEVIKGPQTAYFGRNTFSGAVNIIPKLPGEEWEADIGFEWSPSQEDEYKAEIGVGGPLTDTIGLRVYAGFEKDGGDFETQDGEAYAVFEDTTIAGTLTWEATDRLNMKLSGYYVTADDNGTSIGVDARDVGALAGQCNRTYTGNYVNVVTGELTPFTRDLSQFGGAIFCGQMPDGDQLRTPATVRPTGANSEFGPGRIVAMSNLNPLVSQYDILRTPDGTLGGRNQTWRAAFSADYEFENHTASVLWSHANTGTVDIRDFRFGIPNTSCPAFPLCVLILGNNIATRENYLEARLASSDDRRLRYVVGVSSYRQGYRAALDAPTNDMQVADGVGTRIDFQDNATVALFGSIDYDLTDQLTLSVEARYTDEESETIAEGRWLGPGTCASSSFVCDQVNEYDDFIPRVILSYQLNEGTTIYGSYSYSSLLGVATQAASVSAQVPNVIPPDQVDAIGLYTQPQENTQFELGWKQQGSNYSFTAALFFVDWDNQPLASVVLLPGGGTTAFRGAGDSEYLGIDLEFAYNPTDWFGLIGTVGYVDAEMTSFSSRGSNESVVLGSNSLSVDNSGNEPRNIPPLTYSLSPTFFGEMSGRPWFARFDVLYRDETWADYSSWNRSPDQMLINARVGMDITDQYRVEIYGKNLTEDTALGLTGGTTSGPAGSRKAFNEPYQAREFGVRFTMDF